jgi:hypothetical protein
MCNQAIKWFTQSRIFVFYTVDAYLAGRQIPLPLDNPMAHQSLHTKNFAGTYTTPVDWKLISWRADIQSDIYLVTVARTYVHHVTTSLEIFRILLTTFWLLFLVFGFLFPDLWLLFIIFLSLSFLDFYFSMSDYLLSFSGHYFSFSGCYFSFSDYGLVFSHHSYFRIFIS